MCPPRTFVLALISLSFAFPIFAQRSATSATQSGAQIATLPNPQGGATHEHLTQADFFLDSNTLLPAAIAFNIHPDNNVLEIRFSDYHAVNDAQIAFHVQTFLNNALLLDLQFTTAQLNIGLPAVNLAVEAGL